MSLLGDFAQRFSGGDPIGGFMQFVLNRKQQPQGGQQAASPMAGGNIMQMGGMWPRRRPMWHGGGLYQMQQPGSDSPYAGIGNMMNLWRR